VVGRGGFGGTAALQENTQALPLFLKAARTHHHRGTHTSTGEEQEEELAPSCVLFVPSPSARRTSLAAAPAVSS